jgi:hypothetical protein
LTHHESAALAAKTNHQLERYAVTVEVTVHAWSGDEAAQVVKSFLRGVFTDSKYKMGNVQAANAEPPTDETWSRALDCAGALA